MANWHDPYVKFDFTGTSLEAMFDGTVSGSCVIDGVESSFSANGNKVTLASGLEDVNHTALIKIKRPNGEGGLKYVSTSKDGEIKKTTDVKKYVQFIGDSISESSYSYTFTIPKEYNLDYSVIAYSGIALQDGAGWYFGSSGTIWKPTSEGDSLLTYKDCVGMESAYFCVKRPKEAYYLDENGALKYNNPAFDVASDNQPDAIVIGLGTNDSTYIREKKDAEVGAENFTKTYVEFVKKLSGYYPNAQIYIIRPFNNQKDFTWWDLEKNIIKEEHMDLSADYDDLRAAILKALDELSGNKNVHYIDTTDWNIEINKYDKVHPTEKGYADLRDLVYNEIKGSLK